MKLTREKKVFTVILILYWLGIFAATHIPVPMWARKMGVSDKTMHFAAYMVLGLLLWLADNFEIKANWRKLRPWLITATLIFYGLADELIQRFIAGRSADLTDFTADLLGIAAAMTIVSITSGYNAAIILIIICPVFLPAIVRAQIIKQNSILENAVYLAGFAIITCIWIKYLSLFQKLNFRELKYAPIFLAGPAGTVGILKLYAVLTNKPMGTTAILCAFGSIIITFIIMRFNPAAERSKINTIP